MWTMHDLRRSVQDADRKNLDNFIPNGWTPEDHQSQTKIFEKFIWE